jgi:hypothetical protein
MLQSREAPKRRIGNPAPGSPLVRHDTAGEPSRAPDDPAAFWIARSAPDLAEFAEDLEHPE